MDRLVSRKMLGTLEPYHAIVYLVPEAADAYTAIGLRAGRMSYFAPRAAAMGPVPAEVVIATFFGFQPDVVRAVIPAAWSLATPAAILAARLDLVDRALRRILGTEVLESREMAEAEALARRAAEGCLAEGRPLYAGHASLPYPEATHLALWHSLTLVREFRGDGHIAALVAEGNDGCDAMVMHRATGEIPQTFADSRGWSAQQWADSQERLFHRGWLAADGSLTENGRASRQWVEDRTDDLALPAWERLGDHDAKQLRALMRPWTRAISAETLQLLARPSVET